MLSLDQYEQLRQRGFTRVGYDAVRLQSNDRVLQTATAFIIMFGGDKRKSKHCPKFIDVLQHLDLLNQPKCRDFEFWGIRRSGG